MTPLSLSSRCFHISLLLSSIRLKAANQSTPPVLPHLIMAARCQLSRQLCHRTEHGAYIRGQVWLGQSLAPTTCGDHSLPAQTAANKGTLRRSQARKIGLRLHPSLILCHPAFPPRECGQSHRFPDIPQSPMATLGSQPRSPPDPSHQLLPICPFLQE